MSRKSYTEELILEKLLTIIFVDFQKSGLLLLDDIIFELNDSHLFFSFDFVSIRAVSFTNISINQK